VLRRSRRIAASSTEAISSATGERQELLANLKQVRRYTAGVQGCSATAAGAAALPLILLIFLLSRWSGGLIGRYGERNPLIIGPLLATLGFALFAVPSIGDSYWKTFFPAVVVLGFGMAVTVAPLTTVAMNSVGQDRVGTASGINKAVARVAGVLAVDVLGIVMVSAFTSRLNYSLAHLSLPPGSLDCRYPLIWIPLRALPSKEWLRSHLYLDFESSC
jgi:MFS family permease